MAANAAGIARQEAALKTLRGQMSRAASARDTLGAAVAKTVQAAGVHVPFSKEQDAKALRIVLQGLAKRGVATSAFSSRAGAAATPTKTDLLAIL